MKHLVHSKEQMDYVRIQAEYDFVKKRSLINYLTNEKLNLEQHFHQRTLNMLRQITNYENQNLREQIKQIAIGSFEKVQSAIKDPAQNKVIRD